MLTRFLQSLGLHAFHIHDREPPLTLTGLVFKADQLYSFDTFPLSGIDLDRVKVIYVHGDPVASTLSLYRRFRSTDIYRNLKCTEVKARNLNEFVRGGKDQLRLGDFFDNYTASRARNYNIAVVRYEDLWNNIDKLEEFIGVKMAAKFPAKTPRHKYKVTPETLSALTTIYAELIAKQTRSVGFFVNAKS